MALPCARSVERHWVNNVLAVMNGSLIMPISVSRAALRYQSFR